MLLHQELSKDGRPDLVKSIVVVRTPRPYKLEDLDHIRWTAEIWPELRHLEVWGDFSCVGRDLFRDRFENSVSEALELTVLVGDYHSHETWEADCRIPCVLRLRTVVRQAFRDA
jgi:hypothetical protein